MTTGIFGDSSAGSKITAVIGMCSAVTLGSAFSLTFPGTSLVASWPAPVAGSLYAIAATQSAASSTITFQFCAAINGTQTALITPTLSFNGSQQTVALTAPRTILFNAGDVLTIIGIPSASMTLGVTATATLLVII